MTEASWGQKHICPACASRYYDLRKEAFVCPSCGAKPAPPRVPRSRPGSRPPMRSGFGRYR